jgi:hypothetical protein
VRDAVAVTVAVGVVVAVAVVVVVAVAVAVLVALVVGVVVAVAVTVTVLVAVIVGVAVSVTVGVPVAVAVDVMVGIEVAVGVASAVSVGVASLVGVASVVSVGVASLVGVAVMVEVAVGGGAPTLLETVIRTERTSTKTVPIRAFAAIVCLPFATEAEFHSTAYGGPVPMKVLSTKNLTEVTWGTAVTDIAIVPETVAPASGDVIVISAACAVVRASSARRNPTATAM